MLAFPVVIMISLNFYATGMRQTCITFKSAYGILIQDVHKAYIEAIVNLVVSIILVQKMGIFGVLLGTLISNYAVAFWIEPRVLFKYGFKKKTTKYFGTYFLFMLTYVAGALMTYWSASLVTITGFLGFVIDILLVLTIPNALVWLVWHRSQPYTQLKTTVMAVVKKKLGRV